MNDSLANQINDIKRVKWEVSGLVEASLEWFITYKISNGKPSSKLAFGGEVKNRELAKKIITETHILVQFSRVNKTEFKKYKFVQYLYNWW